MRTIATARSFRDLVKMVDALQGMDYELTEREYEFGDIIPSEEDKKFEYFVSVNTWDAQEAIKRLKATSFSLE